jgi:hypothetical protein
MTDEPLIVRVVARGPLLGSRTVMPAWFETADEVNALWPERTDQARACRSDRAGATNGAERQSEANVRTERPYGGVERAEGVRDDD